MGKSSIAKHLGWGPGSPTAIELGRRVRDQRRRRGLTQSQLGRPLSRGYVSALESGLTLPSLGTLWLLSERLGVTVGELIDGATSSDTGSYTAVHDPSADSKIARGPRRAGPHHRRPIRRARLAAGLTQQQLAAGRYTKAYVSALENGHSKPSMAALSFLAERLGLPTSRIPRGQGRAMDKAPGGPRAGRRPLAAGGRCL